MTAIRPHDRHCLCDVCHIERIAADVYNKAFEEKTVEQVSNTVKTRDARYGGFENVADICQQFKRIMRKSPSYGGMNDVQKEGMEMVLHKCARLLSGDPAHRDSWHDIQGYAKLVEDRLPPEVISTPIVRSAGLGFSIDGT